MDEYDFLLKNSSAIKFGTRNIKSDFHMIPGAMASCIGKQQLYMEEIKEFHRIYRWL
jgi:polyketide biosynthesis 3-hydroxy-3-methylglutaryl-CoA synthase-like enzyme PksG